MEAHPLIVSGTWYVCSWTKIFKRIWHQSSGMARKHYVFQRASLQPAEIPSPSLSEQFQVMGAKWRCMPPGSSLGLKMPYMVKKYFQFPLVWFLYQSILCPDSGSPGLQIKLCPSKRHLKVPDIDNRTFCFQSRCSKTKLHSDPYECHQIKELLCLDPTSLLNAMIPKDILLFLLFIRYDWISNVLA